MKQRRVAGKLQITHVDWYAIFVFDALCSFCAGSRLTVLVWNTSKINTESYESMVTLPK